MTFPNYNDRVPYNYQVHEVSSHVILQDKLSKINFCQTQLRQCYTNSSHIYLDHCSLINFILLPVSSLVTIINTKMFPLHQMTHHSECLMAVAHMMSTNYTKISGYIYIYIHTYIYTSSDFRSLSNIQNHNQAVRNHLQHMSSQHAAILKNKQNS